MGLDFKVDSYGLARFITKSKGKVTPFQMFGKIAKIERNYLLFIDNDLIEYICPIKSFRMIQCAEGQEKAIQEFYENQKW